MDNGLLQNKDKTNIFQFELRNIPSGFEIGTKKVVSGFGLTLVTNLLQLDHIAHLKEVKFTRYNLSVLVTVSSMDACKTV